jgi:hypothetical protein
MKFGASAEELNDAGTKAYLQTPYVGGAKLTKVSAEEIELRDNRKAEVLDIEYVVDGAPADDLLGLPEVKPGLVFTHREWKPRGIDENTPDESGDRPDSFDKVNNLIKRVGYILKYVVGAEMAAKIIQFEANTYPEAWNQLTTRVKAGIAKASEDRPVLPATVEIKVLGEVYEGNARVQFPKYLGFMGNEASGDSVSFTKKEKARVAEWVAFQRAQSAVTAESSDDFESATSSDGDTLF